MRAWIAGWLESLVYSLRLTRQTLLDLDRQRASGLREIVVLVHAPEVGREAREKLREATKAAAERLRLPAGTNLEFWLPPFDGAWVGTVRAAGTEQAAQLMLIVVRDLAEEAGVELGSLRLEAEYDD